MDGWMTLWTFVLIIGLAAFAVTAIVIGIGALSDIRDLFRGLRKQHEQKTGSEAGDSAREE